MGVPAAPIRARRFVTVVCCLVTIGASGCAVGGGHPAPPEAAPVARTAPQPVVELPTDPPSTGGATTAGATTAAQPAGVPTRLIIAIASTHHPSGVTAPVEQHGLMKTGWLYIPAQPSVVAWDSDDVPVTADHGTAIIAGHINYVIHGRTAVGALADLGEYAHSGVGKLVGVTLSSGAVVRFRVEEVRQYTKDQLNADPGLRGRLFDQKGRYGPQQVARLLLVSCGGPFDPNTGEYLQNVFVYAYRV